MAKFTKFDPQEHIRGLAEAARQIQRELDQEEARNFEECLRFFREKAEQLELPAWSRRIQ